MIKHKQDRAKSFYEKIYSIICHSIIQMAHFMHIYSSHLWCIIFGVIQTKLRNRLGLQKATKLVMCYWFLRGKEETGEHKHLSMG